MNNIAINDIGSLEDFLKAIDESMKTYNVGDAVKGTVVQIDREGVLLDIGCKTEGFIPKKEVSARRTIDIRDVVSIGQSVDANIIGIDPEGQYILSMKQAEVEAIWDDVEAIWNSDNKVVNGEILKLVKGGMIVDIGIRAFLPSSQSFIDKNDDFSRYVGRTIDANIIDFNREKGNVVISRKAYIEKEQKEDKTNQFNLLEVGQVYTGRVSGITNFGVFVSLGLLSGLVHQSKMGKYTPEQFTIGHDIAVEVIDMDIDKDRLSFALKA